MTQIILQFIFSNQNVKKLMLPASVTRGSAAFLCQTLQLIEYLCQDVDETSNFMYVALGSGTFSTAL